MRLSAPLFRLKRRARLLSRDEKIPLNVALDRIAREEGFTAWSLLSAHHAKASPTRAMLSRLEDGDLLLLAARPGHGKTLIGLQLLLDAVKEGRNGVFFTLVHTEREVVERLRSLGSASVDAGGPVSIVTSDDICSDLIISHMDGAEAGTIAVIDYLQVLDQQRSKPELSVQIDALGGFARGSGVVLAFLSQISRAYDPALKPLPDIRDINLPNRLDPAVFSKTCFLHDGEMRFQATA